MTTDAVPGPGRYTLRRQAPSEKLTSPTLDQRYGRQRPRKRLGTRAWLSIAAVAIIVSAAFAAWIALSDADAPTFKEVSFDIESADQAGLDFELTKDDDAVVTCAVQALNDQHAIVGWDEVSIGQVPEDQLSNRTSAHHVQLLTTSPAHTVTVDSCWPSDS